MALNFEETKFVIDRVLEFSRADINEELKVVLTRMKQTMPAVYEGVLEHGPYMNFYTSAQWLDFHLKVPHWRLRRDKDLMAMLSPRHREMLEE